MQERLRENTALSFLSLTDSRDMWTVALDMTPDNGDLPDEGHRTRQKASMGAEEYSRRFSGEECSSWHHSCY